MSTRFSQHFGVSGSRRTWRIIVLWRKRARRIKQSSMILVRFGSVTISCAVRLGNDFLCVVCLIQCDEGNFYKPLTKRYRAARRLLRRIGKIALNEFTNESGGVTENEK